MELVGQPRRVPPRRIDDPTTPTPTSVTLMRAAIPGPSPHAMSHRPSASLLRIASAALTAFFIDAKYRSAPSPSKSLTVPAWANATSVTRVMKP